jgi:hypothetical protein
MKVLDETLEKKREEFFGMCRDGIHVMNDAADHLLQFNFSCIILERLVDEEELEALSNLVVETKRCCALVRLRNRELFGSAREIPPFDLVVERFCQSLEFLEVVIARSGL